MITVLSTDAEVAFVTSRGAIPFADCFKEKLEEGGCSIYPDSSNAEFAVGLHTCCALLLDNVAGALSMTRDVSRKIKKNVRVVAVPHCSAMAKVDVKLYKKLGTPESTMSGCNPSRHAMHGCEYVRPFGEMEYEEVLLKHGTPLGTHIHMNVPLHRLKGIVKYDAERYRFDTESFSEKLLSEWLKQRIAMYLIPVLYIMKGANDDDNIRERFKLLPPGYFRLKSYGIELKDAPSTVLRHPAYMAAAFMSARAIIDASRPRKFNVNEALDAIANVDREKIEYLFKILHPALHKVDYVSYGSIEMWERIASYSPSFDIFKEWKIKEYSLDEYTKGLHRGHNLGLISSSWDVGNHK